MPLKGSPLGITILQYSILRYAVLLLITFAAAAVMLAVSRKMKSPSACMMLLAAVFAVPCAAVMLG